MIVQDVMVKDVKTIGGESSVQEAAEDMRKYKIGSLVVVKSSKLVGILTDRDLLDKIVAEAIDSSTIKVKDVMTKNVVMVTPDKDIGEAAELMMEKKIKKLPVVNGHQLVGIVTATDLCTAEPKIIEQIGSLMLLPKKKAVAG